MSGGEAEKSRGSQEARAEGKDVTVGNAARTRGVSDRWSVVDRELWATDAWVAALGGPARSEPETDGAAGARGGGAPTPVSSYGFRRRTYPGRRVKGSEGGRNRVRITDVECHVIGHAWKNWVLVRMVTDAGLEGVGEATLEHRTRAVAEAVREFAPYVIGRDPADVEDLVLTLRRDTYTPGILVNTVLSGFETAMWDILGQYHREPVYRLLGGAVRQRIPVYANGWYRVDRHPEAFAGAADLALDRGFRAIKFDPFGASQGRLTDPAFRLAMALIEAVADRATRRNAKIIIEGHGRFDLPTAKRIARAIRGYDPLWLEEPCYPSDLRGLRELRQQTEISIAAGERLVHLSDFRHLLDEGEVDIVQPDPAHVGGILAARKIAAVAESFCRSCTFHSPLSPVTTAVAMQLAAVCANFDIQEDFDPFNAAWVHDIFGAPPAIVEGTVPLPDEPGIGIRINWDAAREHPYDPHSRQLLFEPGWEHRQGRHAE